MLIRRVVSALQLPSSQLAVNLYPKRIPHSAAAAAAAATAAAAVYLKCLRCIFTTAFSWNFSIVA